MISYSYNIFFVYAINNPEGFKNCAMPCREAGMAISNKIALNLWTRAEIRWNRKLVSLSSPDWREIEIINSVSCHIDEKLYV